MGGQAGTIIGHAACVLQVSRIASQAIPASQVLAPTACGRSLSPGVVAPIMWATECYYSHPGLWRCSMAVTALEIKTCSPFAHGKTFGDVGPYQQLDGTVHFAVDPDHPANAGITDLQG